MIESEPISAPDEDRLIIVQEIDMLNQPLSYLLLIEASKYTDQLMF